MSITVQQSVPLHAYSVFRIGGPAKFFTVVSSAEELKEALLFARKKNIPFFIAGAGSNILIADSGLDGLFIRNNARSVRVTDHCITAESGVMMAYLAHEAYKHGLSGVEWGIGIPGTVGGSIRGNAGCFGREMKDIIHSVKVFDTVAGEVKLFSHDMCMFTYRDSLFKQHPTLILLEGVCDLIKDDQKIIQDRMKLFAEKRSRTQDIGLSCAGCIFKNVVWTRKDIEKDRLLTRFPILKQFASQPSISSGFLIDEVGLKGKSVGGATISRKHANFFINREHAKAGEVVMLIALAKELVHRKFGILLEEEIQYVGF